MKNMRSGIEVFIDLYNKGEAELTNIYVTSVFCGINILKCIERKI